MYTIAKSRSKKIQETTLPPPVAQWLSPVMTDIRLQFGRLYPSQMRPSQQAAEPLLEEYSVVAAILRNIP